MKNIVKFWLTAQGYLSSTGTFRNGLLFGFQYGTKVFMAVENEDHHFILVTFDMKTGEKVKQHISTINKEYALYKMGVLEACHMLLDPPADLDALISEAGEAHGADYRELLRLAKLEGKDTDLLRVPTYQAIEALQYLYPF